jgi:DNA-binding transcriptional regulator YbjK
MPPKPRSKRAVSEAEVLAGTGTSTTQGVARERMIEAAIDVLREAGIEGLTHRRVAAAAGVPLGSITYYFSSMEGLLVAALETTAHRDIQEMRDELGRLPAGASLAETMARHIARRASDEDRQGSVLAIELYAAALRRQSIRELAVAWDRAWLEALSARVGEVVAVATLAAASGLIQRALLEQEAMSFDEILQVMTYVLREGDV